MDAVEHGLSFTVTRDGHRIAEPIPLRRRRRFITRQEFTAISHNASAIDIETFRVDQDALADHEAPVHTTGEVTSRGASRYQHRDPAP